MNREERAKQFMPFDALKGLNEELRRREKKMLREERRVLFEEEAEKLSSRLARLQVGDEVEAVFYENGYYLTLCGKAESVNRSFGFLTIGERRVYFADLYRLRFL
ncbi:MAG: YolD-like family protein [Clostridia bacterium]|nr:YolD-like family protein [Clostridia bacterium]